MDLQTMENEWLASKQRIAALEAKLEVADHGWDGIDSRNETIRLLEAEVAELRQVCRDAYEVWAGSEGIPVAETAPESYLLGLLLQMRDEVKRGLK